jgi:hypothetical protein
VTHQAVNLVHRDDARLLVTQAVTANGRQHLGVGQRGHDRVAFQFVEREDARPDLLPAAAPKIHCRVSVEELRPGTRSGAQPGDLVSQVAGDLLNMRFVAQPGQHVTHRLA